MPRLGLALSGGGLRATLFHLGVVRFLRDAGLLKDVSHMVSVSGGSILAAHIALNWERYTGSETEFNEAASEILKFAQLDVRNRIVRRLPLAWPFRQLQRLTLQGLSRRFLPSGLLEGYYDQCLFHNKAVHELPETPELHILATNVSDGCLCSFNRDGLFMERRDEGSDELDRYPARLAKISLAVACSSAFPGFFPPVMITAGEIGLQEGEFATQAFTDGGVYDNLGVRAFNWFREVDPPLDEVLVSDTGQKFRILPKKTLGVVGQALRASDILWDRVWQLEKFNFQADQRFLFVPSTETVDLKEDPTALNPVIQPEVQNIRTDLDRFSDLEVRVLVQHGYCVARKQCRSASDVFGENLPSSPPWNPIPSKRDTPKGTQEAPPTSVSKPSDATEEAKAIRKSANRRIWSTLLDLRDWPTYIYIPLLIFLLVVCPYLYYRSYRQARINETVLAAIANGDPEFKKILELVNKNPVVVESTAKVRNEPKALPRNDEGIEHLVVTRVIDLRRWSPNSPQVYSYNRTRIRKTPDHKGDNKIRFQFEAIQVEDLRIRLAPEKLNPILIKTDEDVVRKDFFGGKAKIWQIECDLSDVRVGKMVDVVMELQFKLPKFKNNASFSYLAKHDTAVNDTWLLFPENKPYRKYKLLEYNPETKSETNIDSRFNIDHPYGTLIGWSVLNAKKGRIYECQWEWAD